MRKPWAKWEDQYLRKSWPDKSDEEIGQLLGRSKIAVQTRRYKLGIAIDPAEWSPQEDAYILEHWRDQTDEEIAAALNREPHAAYERGVSLGLVRRRPALMGSRMWTPEEITYLSENWGTVSVKNMSKRLQRTETAIIVKSQKLGLGAYLDSGDYITLHQLIVAVTGTSAGYGYKIKSWVQNRGMPVHTKLVKEKRVRIIYLEEFWEWAEKNRSFLDFSKMEPLALGEEPEWVAEQRRKDFRAFAIQRKDPWTPDEDSRLKMLLKQHKYGYAELSEMLHRSAGAIQKRCTDLGLKERPVKADNHSKESAWTDADFQTLAEGIRRGDSYTMIGRDIGKSEKAIRGKVYFVYLTESADKIRAMMGDGPWGYGAPEPTVKQGIHLSRCRAAVKKDLSVLVALLKYRMNELGYDPYWQRFMCMNWGDIDGCSAGCSDCDSCTEFVRIKPQYCARCGATFYERHENRFCQNCRIARKKAAQRRWCRLNAGR